MIASRKSHGQRDLGLSVLRLIWQCGNSKPRVLTAALGSHFRAVSALCLFSLFFASALLCFYCWLLSCLLLFIAFSQCAALLLSLLPFSKSSSVFSKPSTCLHCAPASWVLFYFVLCLGACKLWRFLSTSFFFGLCSANRPSNVDISSCSVAF